MTFGKDFERRKLRLYFSDGHVADGLIVDVAEPEDGDGFVFDSLNHQGVAAEKKPAVWAKFADLQRYEVLEN